MELIYFEYEYVCNAYLQPMHTVPHLNDLQEVSIPASPWPLPLASPLAQVFFVVANLLFASVLSDCNFDSTRTRFTPRTAPLLYTFLDEHNGP
jgi:hypothetical protein